MIIFLGNVSAPWPLKTDAMGLFFHEAFVIHNLNYFFY